MCKAFGATSGKGREAALADGFEDVADDDRRRYSAAVFGVIVLSVQIDTVRSKNLNPDNNLGDGNSAQGLPFHAD